MAEKNKQATDSSNVEPLQIVTSSLTNRQLSKRHHDDQYHTLVLETRTPPENPKKSKLSPLSDPTPSLPILPYEVTVEILSRLPVKSLIRFRCVSKSFKTLISDPHFVRNHLTKITSSKNKPNLLQKIVLTCGGSRFRHLKTCSLHSIYNNSQTDAIKLKSNPLKNSCPYDWLVGTCDGLLCLAVKRDFVVLWNPSMRVFNRLPDLDFKKKPGSYVVFGFGYDSEMDDYKVVAAFCFNRFTTGDFGYGTRVEVCSLRTRCWRRIEGFGYGVPCDVSGKYVKGSLIWPVWSQNRSGLLWIIVSFDLASETYKELKQPDYGDARYAGYARTLGVLDGCLCVMCKYSAIRDDIWVMKEYGVTESWTKLISIPYMDNLSSRLYSVPYCIADNGEVLLDFDHVFVICNPKDGTFRYPVINGAPNWLEAEIYVESLVSPI